MSIILKSNQTCFTVAMLALALGSATYFASGAAEKPPRATDNPDYNIFFVILDDVGADQLNISNPAGTALASTPTINASTATVRVSMVSVQSALVCDSGNDR